MNNLKKFRKSKELTQQDVADYLNIGRSSYTKYESSIHLPDVYILDKLATLFNVTIDELVGRTNASSAKKTENDQELLLLLEKLQQLSATDIKEIESFIDFKQAKKNWKTPKTNIG